MKCDSNQIFTGVSPSGCSNQPLLLRTRMRRRCTWVLYTGGIQSPWVQTRLTFVDLLFTLIVYYRSDPKLIIAFHTPGRCKRPLGLVTAWCENVSNTSDGVNAGSFIRTIAESSVLDVGKQQKWTWLPMRGETWKPWYMKAWCSLRHIRDALSTAY